jgi:TolB-like protein
LKSLVVLLVLAAGVSSAAQKQKVVVTGISTSTAALERLATALTDAVATDLSRSGVAEPVTPQDLASVLGLEKQKQLLGCSDESTTCMAEMTAALGAPWVVAGSLSRLGSTTRLDLKLVRAKDGRISFRDGRTVTDDSQLYAAVSELVRGLVTSPDFSAASGVVAVADFSTVMASPPPKVVPWVVAALGGGALVAGGIVSASAAASWGNLQSESWRASTYWQGIETETAAYRRNVVLGPVLAGAGAVAAVSGLIWALSGKPAAAAVSIAPTANGVLVRGEW